MRPALDESGRDGIAGPCEDDGGNPGGLGGGGARIAQGDQNLRSLLLQLLDETRQLGEVRHRAARRKGEIMALCVAELGQRAEQDLAERGIRSYGRSSRDRSQVKSLAGLGEGRRGREA